jgi:hypothetical protein
MSFNMFFDEGNKELKPLIFYMALNNFKRVFSVCDWSI